MPSYLERYQTGECNQVYEELMALGETVYIEPVFSDATAVANEMMHRLRHNLDLLLPRLRALGFDFIADPAEYDHNDDPPQLIDPDPRTDKYLKDIETAWGPLPITLKAFWHAVGAVNLWGEFPAHLHFPTLDGLMVYSARILHEAFTKDPQPYIGLYHDNCWVGQTYMEPPFAVFDAPLRFEGDILTTPDGHQSLTFVRQLRLACAWGSFWDRPYYLDTEKFPGEQPPAAVLADLIEGFLPL